LDEILHFTKYSALAIVSVIIYSLDVHSIINGVTGFVFCVSVIMIIVLLAGMYIEKQKKLKPAHDTGKVKPYMPERPDVFPRTSLENQRLTISIPGRFCIQENYWGPEAQEKISNKSVSVIGIGSKGSVVAELLARAGIGNLKLIDDDILDGSDLGRGGMFTSRDLGRTRVGAAQEHLMYINGQTYTEGHSARLSERNMAMLDSNLILDCTNADNTYLFNFCKKKKIPLLSLRVDGDQGFVTTKPVKEGASAHSNPGVHFGAGLLVTEAYKMLLNQKVENELNFSLKAIRMHR